MSAAEDDGQPVRLTARVYGRVQGVGFRYWVRRKSEGLGLSGTATNLDDGSVEVIAEGGEAACRQLLADLGSGATPGRVARMTHRWGTAKGDMSGFAER
jgi:acylphosphatase